MGAGVEEEATGAGAQPAPTALGKDVGARMRRDSVTDAATRADDGDGDPHKHSVGITWNGECKLKESIM